MGSCQAMKWAVGLLVLVAMLSTTALARADEDELVLTPFGYWPAACAHSAPTGFIFV